MSDRAIQFESDDHETILRLDSEGDTVILLVHLMRPYVQVARFRLGPGEAGYMAGYLLAWAREYERRCPQPEGGL